MSGMSELEPQDARIEEQRRRVAWHSAFLRGDLSQILRALYAHEINVGMQSFWDGGWDVWFGDDMNGPAQPTISVPIPSTKLQTG